MPADLSSLILDLTGLDRIEIEELGRDQFRAACIDANGYGIRLTHDGQDVEFWESRFDHAFSSVRDLSALERVRAVDGRRVARIKWICEVLAGRVPNSDCWETQQNLLKRFYRVVPKGYIIWLEKYQTELWTFSSAYTADGAYLHAQTRGNGAKRVWKYGQKNAP